MSRGTTFVLVSFYCKILISIKVIRFIFALSLTVSEIWALQIYELLRWCQGQGVQFSQCCPAMANVKLLQTFCARFISLKFKWYEMSVITVFGSVSSGILSPPSSVDTVSNFLLLVLNSPGRCRDTVSDDLRAMLSSFNLNEHLSIPTRP